MTDAYRMAPAALMSATSAAGPLLTALAGWFFFAEVPDAEGQVGMGILVVTSVLLPLLGR
jgi:drug/metabolite transporter (DMT)-like permease